MTEGRRLAPLLGLLAACAASSAPQGPQSPQDPQSLVLWDVHGAPHRPLDPRGTRANVLIFTTVDCPIANGYAPEIAAIAAEFEPAGFRFYMVHVDPDVDDERAAAHGAQYGIELPILLDPAHDLVSATGATVTPEAAVVGPDGALLYRGRIDDLYADLGRKRLAPTRHDLREALAALAAGGPLAEARTEPVGCYIPDLP